MQQLDVMATEKKYKHFQFFGFVDGTLVGAVNLNGTPMHTLSGESGNISNNAAQYAAKYDENVIGVEITRGVPAPILPLTMYEYDFETPAWRRNAY